MKKNKKKNHPDWLVKAYNNYEFLNSPPGRPIRVLAELLEPRTRFHKQHVHNTVVFFGSARILPRQTALFEFKELESRVKNSKRPTAKMKKDLQAALTDLEMSRYYEEAALLSARLTKWFKTLEKKNVHFHVCSGGGPGIMEAANLGAVKAKGRSVGLNISLPMEQIPNPYQTKELACEFHYFFIRKFWFFYLAKALVIFPGGYGTMDELFELLTLIQTGKTQKKLPVVLYDSSFWDSIVDFDAMEKWGVIDRSDMKLFRVCNTVGDAFSFLKKELTRLYVSEEQKRKRKRS